MRFLKKIFGPDQIDDEPLDKQKEDIGPFLEFGIEEGCDEISGTTEAFGYHVNNPIPVNGVRGEICYINRLRSKSGVGFFYHRLGSERSPISKHPIDKYELVAIDTSKWAIIYFSPYHERRSTKVPDGLSIIPWSSMDEKFRLMSKINGFGTNGYVEDFPLGLPEVIAKSPSLNSISPGLGKAMTKPIVKILKENEGNWQRPYIL